MEGSSYSVSAVKADTGQLVMTALYHQAHQTNPSIPAYDHGRRQHSVFWQKNNTILGNKSDVS